MAAVLHDHGARGMVVMDGRHLLAKARPTHGVWVLRLYGACWIDTMRDEERAAHYRRMKLPRGTSPELKTVTTKREAQRHLEDITKQHQGEIR